MGWAVLVRGWLPPRRVLLCMFPCGVHPAFVLAIFQRSSSCQYLPGSDLRSLSLDFSPPAHPPVVGSPSLPLLCSQIIYPNLQSLLAPATRVASLATHRWLLIGGSEVKASACNVGDLGSIPRSERSLGEGNGNPLQYSCLENGRKESDTTLLSLSQCLKAGLWSVSTWI